jgi:hypothetical protein
MNYSYTNIGQYKSIDSILNSFSSDFFDGVTMILRPIIGGVDYLRYIRQSHLAQKELNKLSKWDFDKRDRFLDILTDIVSGDIYDKSFMVKIEEKISTMDEYKETFAQLGRLTTKLNPAQRNEILRISLNKLNGKISSVRDNINLKMWDKNEDVNQLMVLDQILYLIQEQISETIRKKDSDILLIIVFSLLKLEAFRRNKISFEAFQIYISELSLFKHHEGQVPRNYYLAFETLGLVIK